MENIEIWKDIIGYEGLYQCSNLGRIKSLGNNKRRKEKILKQAKNNKGYWQVSLCKEGEEKHYLVHRLVCTAFIPNPNNYCVVNHRDENPSNNCVSNLEWVTQKYNINYGTTKQRISNALKDKPNLPNSKPILQFNREGTKIIGKWNSAHQVERELNIKQSNICKCCKGKLKSCGGFKWMFLEDYYNARTLNRMYNIFTKLNELKKAS